MFGIGEKDSDGRQKRIEHRGRNLRVSRTGGVSIREQIRVAGVNITANSKHGARVSTRVAKGTNVGLQNGNFRLRGRYGKGPTKLNLSKSGISVSTKNALGTFNWLKPNRSSAKIMGVQVRGKNAATLQMIYAAFSLGAFVVKAVVVVTIFLAQMLWVFLQLLFAFLCWLFPILWAGCMHFELSLYAVAHSHKRKKLLPLAEALASDPIRSLRKWALPELETALTDLVTVGGRGEPLAKQLDEIFESIDAKTAADRLRILFLAVVTVHREKADEPDLVPLFLDIDGQCVEEGGRTCLQDLLLEDYAGINRLKLKEE